MTDWARLRADIAREATTIAVGSTASVECPKCTGGNTGERSMSLTRAANGAMFLCHRASCGFRGFVGMDGGGTSRDMPRKKKARPYTGTAYALDDYEALKLASLYKGFSLNSFSVRMALATVCTNGAEVLVFPCYGFNGELLGHVTRTPDKAIKTYRATDNRDMYAVYRPTTKIDSGVLVIVEDCISAMCCASHGYTGIALLGTHLTPEVRDAIKAQAFTAVVARLDPDANSKALAIANANGWQAEFSECDPKDDPELGTMAVRL